MSEAEVNTQLVGNNTPSESTTDPHSNPTPYGFGPLGVRILSGPPSKTDSESSDEPVHPTLQKRKVRLGPIAIMTTHTPRPTRAQGQANYTIDEAGDYQAQAAEHARNCAFYVRMAGENPPQTPAPAEPADNTDVGARNTWVGDLYAWANEYDEEARRVRAVLAAAAAAGTAAGSVRAATAAPTAPPPRRKFPLPGRYEGTVGDPAITFLTQCNNYFATEGTTWDGNYRIRWALQFLEGKAGPWAELQIRRMTEEADDITGAPPDELDHWNMFQDFFRTQWYDSGALINARARWKQGFNQIGSAKDYFVQVEPVLTRLGYVRDSDQVIDAVFGGLKSHIKIHYALEQWGDFNTMKERCIAYDEAYFAHNKRGLNTPNYKGKDKKKTAQTAATDSKTGDRLSTEDWNLCKTKGLCFVCKKVGKDTFGLAREHPNHPPRETRKVEGVKKDTTKKVDSGKGKKKASVKAIEGPPDSSVDNEPDSDSDADSSDEQTKN